MLLCCLTSVWVSFFNQTLSLGPRLWSSRFIPWWPLHVCLLVEYHLYRLRERKIYVYLISLLPPILLLLLFATTTIWNDIHPELETSGHLQQERWTNTSSSRNLKKSEKWTAKIKHCANSRIIKEIKWAHFNTNWLLLFTLLSQQNLQQKSQITTRNIKKHIYSQHKDTYFYRR